MSFILQLFDAPEARTVAAAIAAVDAGAPPLSKAKVDAFVAGVITCFPDLSEEDDDGDDEINVWPEGLALGVPESSVVNLGVKAHFVEPGVLSIIAEHALRAGLQVFDPQNAMLYRADRVVIDADSRTQPFRGLTAFAMQAIRAGEAALSKRPRASAAPSTPALTVEGVRALVVQRLMPNLAARGFEHRRTERIDLITRQHGEVRQSLVLDAGSANEHVVMRAKVWLSWPPLARLWVPLLPPVFVAWVERGDQELAGCQEMRDIHESGNSLRAG